MKLLFVSGPDAPSTIASGLMLMKKGYAVYYGQPLRIKLSHYAPLLQIISEDNQWRMRWNVSDMEMIKRCDGIYMCEHWTKESLCNVQMSYAKNLNKQVFFEGLAEPRE
jgi:hypothetical protein